jgi:hypothetical protein
MRVSGSFPSLVNGVSQQVNSLRLPNQAEDIENAVSSLVEGCKKRPPALYLNILQNVTISPDLPANEAAYHWINTDEGKKFLVVLAPAGIKVFDLEGTPQTVTVDGDGAYVTGGAWSPSKFRFLTLADTTFIVNTTKVTALSSTLTTAAKHEAWVWVKSGVTNIQYKLTVAGTAVTFKLTTGTTHTTDVSTGLVTSLTTALAAATWTITRYENYIHIKRVDGADFDIQALDDYGNTLMSVVKERVALLSDLPSDAPNNFIVQITGSADAPSDDYYVKFAAERANTYGRGQWVECVAPGVKSTFDGTTMPHTLERRSDGTFHFNVAAWVARAAGDDATNPGPSFIGSTIADVFLFKNRLGFLCQDKVFMSTAADFLNLWRTTVTSLLDDAPIDTPVPGSGTSILRWAVPFDQSLLLFSTDHQFLLQGQDILSPRTVSITMTTAYEGSSLCRPVSSGNSVFFAFPSGSYSGIGEYFVDQKTGVNDAATITAHCPRYILGDAQALAASATAETLLVASGDSTLAVYQWKWAGDQKAQSAWTKWRFATSVVSCTMVDNLVYLVLKWNGKRILAYIPLTGLDLYTSPATSLPHCDMIYQVTPSTLLSGTWWCNLPYWAVSASTPTFSLFFANEHVCDVVGKATVTNVNPNWVVTTRTFTEPWGWGGPYIQVGLQYRNNQTLVAQDFIDNFMCWGYAYNFTYTFSQPFIKDDVSGGKSTVEDGVLKVQSMYVRSAKSGPFDVSVTSRRDGATANNPTYSYSWSPFTGYTDSGVLQVPSEDVRTRQLSPCHPLALSPAPSCPPNGKAHGSPNLGESNLEEVP